MAAPVRKRQFPIIGDGGGVFHIHIDDAAAATVAAVEHGGRLSTTSSTTSPRRCGVATGAGKRAWRQATKAYPTLAGAARGGEMATLMIDDRRARASNAKPERESRLEACATRVGSGSGRAALTVTRVGVGSSDEAERDRG